MLGEIAALRERLAAAEAELAIERERNGNRVICPKCGASLPCESCSQYCADREVTEARIEQLEGALRERLIEAEVQRDRWEPAYQRNIRENEARIEELEGALRRMRCACGVRGRMDRSPDHGSGGRAMSAPEYGPIRVVRDGLPRNGQVPIHRYERDRLTDCPEGCRFGIVQKPDDGKYHTGEMACPTCPDEHPGKVVKPCGKCARKHGEIWLAAGLLEGSIGWSCCNGTGVETQRITRERVMEALVEMAKFFAAPFDHGPDDAAEAAFVLAILEAGLL
jgi:hypothetical protein